MVVALLEHGDRDGAPLYVVTRRGDQGHLPRSWELPGGGIEPGESAQEALHRELREELGVTVEAVRPLTFSWYAYPDRVVLILFFHARTVPGSEPRPLVAGELRSIDRDELVALEMPPANQPLRELLLRSGGTRA